MYISASDLAGHHEYDGGLVLSIEPHGQQLGELSHVRFDGPSDELSLWVNWIATPVRYNGPLGARGWTIVSRGTQELVSYVGDSGRNWLEPNGTCLIDVQVIGAQVVLHPMNADPLERRLIRSLSI